MSEVLYLCEKETFILDWVHADIFLVSNKMKSFFTSLKVAKKVGWSSIGWLSPSGTRQTHLWLRSQDTKWKLHHGQGQLYHSNTMFGDPQDNRSSWSHHKKLSEASASSSGLFDHFDAEHGTKHSQTSPKRQHCKPHTFNKIPVSLELPHPVHSINILPVLWAQFASKHVYTIFLFHTKYHFLPPVGVMTLRGK